MGRGRFAGGFVSGIVFVLVATVVGGYVYLRYGHPPVATSDRAFPMEAQIVNVPLSARIAREVRTAPFAADEAGLQAGAHVYKANCAGCHGAPGHDSAYAKYMFPGAPQLWVKHSHSDVVGVSDDEAGETYWKVANGIRLTGMPSYQHLLSDTEMWQVSLLLKNADQKLSPVVMATLASQ